MGARVISWICLTAAAVILSGCLGPTGPSQSLRPSERPAGFAPSPDADNYQPSANSQALRRYFGRLEQDQKVRGLMRTDGGGLDSAFTDRMVTDNFLQIALFDEHPNGQSLSVSAPQAITLRRWLQPVRLGLIQGPSVSATEAAWQRQQTVNYAARLSQAANHPISYSETAPNFHILVLDEDERIAAGDLMRSLVPGADARTLQRVQSMPRSVQCVVIAFFEPGSNTYTNAIAVLRSEHPRDSWKSCLHEEVAQGLGLPNDSRFARPSIFNEDEEFALLTTHDEILLRILYDRRLRPGMTQAAARPLVAQIADEIMNTNTTAGPIILAGPV